MKGLTFSDPSIGCLLVFYMFKLEYCNYSYGSCDLGASVGWPCCKAGVDPTLTEAAPRLTRRSSSLFRRPKSYSQRVFYLS